MSFLKKIQSHYEIKAMPLQDWHVGDKLMRIAGKQWTDSQVVVIDDVRYVKDLHHNSPLILEVLDIANSRLHTKAGWLHPDICERV